MNENLNEAKEIICEVLMATLADDASGIELRLVDEKGSIHVRFVERDLWGKIKPDQNPKKELQKIVDIFNGYEFLSNGEKRLISNFQPKKIKLVL